MAICDTCGNDYWLSFEVRTITGETHTFDSFECAIHKLAPTCEHCGCKIAGHGVEASGRFFCCGHCARSSDADTGSQIRDAVGTRPGLADTVVDMDDDAVERVLAAKPEMTDLGRAAYELLLELYPDAVVSVDGGDIGFGSTSGYKGLMFTLSPHREHVTIGIANGAALPDPDGLLQGKGKLHRHVKLRSRSDLDDPRLRLLLSAALMGRE